MYLLSLSGMEAALWVSSQTKTFGKAVLAPLLAVCHWLRQAMVGKPGTVTADDCYVRRTPSFVMLVESDVKEGVSGLLP